MISCPKCKELLAEDIKICPFCRHEITDHERVLITKALSEERRKASSEEEKLINDRGAKRMLWLAFTVGFIILMFILLMVFCTSPLMNQPFAYKACAGIVAVTGFGGMLSSALWVFTPISRCPHCNSYLFHPFGSYCHRCGGRI